MGRRARFDLPDDGLSRSASSADSVRSLRLFPPLELGSAVLIDLIEEMSLDVPQAGESLSRNPASPGEATTRYAGHSKEAKATDANLRQESQQAAPLLLL